MPLVYLFSLFCFVLSNFVGHWAAFCEAVHILQWPLWNLMLLPVLYDCCDV